MQLDNLGQFFTLPLWWCRWCPDESKNKSSAITLMADFAHYKKKHLIDTSTRENKKTRILEHTKILKEIQKYAEKLHIWKITWIKTCENKQSVEKQIFNIQIQYACEWLHLPLQSIFDILQLILITSTVECCPRLSQNGWDFCCDYCSFWHV